jgi:pectate lyase
MKHKILVLVSLSLCISFAYAQSVTITEASGWLESAYVKWQPVTGADSYNVYYSGSDVTDKKIDNQLIRSYGTYFRADISGLKPGTYTIKVAPVTGGTEGTATISGSVSVFAHDRSGYAFWNGRVPGAYKADGTPKDGAVIIYVTEKTKNTVSMTVTGANANPCVGFQAILDGFKKGKDNRPLIVRMIGQITDPATTYSGDIVIENSNNASGYITVEGIGDDAVADGWGIRIKNASNIEIRNLGFMNCNSSEGDNLGLQQDNDYIWAHNCDMFYGDAGSDADQIKGDGALDCKKSTYVTFSYNHFWDNGKCNLLGLSEGTTTGLFITYHHNWYDHSDSRHPRVRFYSAHVYNNYYDGNAKYGAGSTEGSSVFMEGNYFRNCKYPMLTSMQGSDVWNESTQSNDYKNMPTFSSEDGGTIKAFNNYMTGQHRFVAYGDAAFNNSTVDFDAYVVANRTDQVPATVKSVYGSNTYNNFDTNSSMIYTYTADSPDDAKAKVTQYAGRVAGGDLKWTFNNTVDDASYAVNTNLKAALTTYKTTMVFIQGEGSTPIASSQLLDLTSGSNNLQTITSGAAIDTIVYTWGGDATDASVTGLPASGLSFAKDATAKTITITGTPTATVSYTVTTSGTNGTPVSATGTITLTGSGTDAGNMIQNFTANGKTSTFYTITGNLSTSYGTVSYSGLTLTSCLKMESSTNIAFATTQSGTLTLVYNGAYTGSIKLDGVTQNVTSASGASILTFPLAAGSHTLIKGSGSTYLFYMSVVYDSSTGIADITGSKKIIYPNPVTDKAFITIDPALITKAEIFNLSGIPLKQVRGNAGYIDMTGIRSGCYLIKISTTEGTVQQMVIKK